MMNRDQEAYWRRTYAELHQTGCDWLDYASSQEQMFTFGACLLIAGPVVDTRCLDAGCGRGTFARMLLALGAREVVATDFVTSTIQMLRVSAPEVRWLSGSMSDAAFSADLGFFDTVFAIEMLQYGPSASLLTNLWAGVVPGGRLVGVVPNADNPFVQRTRDKFGGLYAPLGLRELLSKLETLPQVADSGVMGFQWRKDRTNILYDLLPMTREPQWASPPKRLLFLARKAADGMCC
jgi:2-polyprenyl-3-methyl-5-hydroxy-6-metoxy-1,4-benzoquinol methylase